MHSFEEVHCFACCEDSVDDVEHKSWGGDDICFGFFDEFENGVLVVVVFRGGGAGGDEEVWVEGRI